MAGAKALLGGADADHGDACGRRYLLGGMVMASTGPPLLGCQGKL